jgi:probable HAF family extracellular repeat protein
MKSNFLVCAAVALLAVAMPVSLAAQDKVKEDHPHQYHHYQFIDVGTFGGPQSFLFFGGLGANGVLNNQGTLAGWADTSTIDPLCYFDNPDCNAAHAFVWQNGRKIDLGVLPGGLNSQVNWISADGVTAGAADNGQMDPLAGIPQIHAVLWKNGGIVDLGLLPEGGFQSFTGAVNSRGEVVGNANNTIPDPNSLFTGYPYQTRAFYWKDGVMQDLGTLGTGTDAEAGLINERGQVVGLSYTSSTQNASCAGFGFAFTTGTFLWDIKNGMKDIGGLGGSCTRPSDLNDRGQVVGFSDLADQSTHPFVWDSATGMTDLGKVGESFGGAVAINNHGEIAGFGFLNGGGPDAILWRKRRGKWRMTDLGTLSGCAGANSVNASVQVVGTDGCPGLPVVPFLWEDGGPMVDLNTLIPPNTGLQLHELGQINDRGEITVSDADANGNSHAVLLIPCDENHPSVEGCDYSMVDAAAAAQSAAPSYVPSATPRLPHSWRSNRYHMPGRAAERGTAAIAAQVSPVPERTPPPPVFFVSVTPFTPSSVNPGGSSTSAVTAGLTGGGGGASTAALTCSVQPSPPLAPTCSISPASLSFPGTPATLTVSTVGPSGALLSRRDPKLLYALWLPLIGLVATGAGLRSNPSGHKGKLKKVALGCALFAGLTFLLACGGGNGQRTPPGTYTIGVTATAFIPVNTAFDSKPLTVQ